ncbi:MAG: glycosyltransferase family 2 protein [Zavarzinella sp.]
MTVFAAVLLAFAVVPLLIYLWNQFYYRRPKLMPGDSPKISVLIPARNEEASIEAAVFAACNSKHVDVDIVVLDDHSQDRTAAIVEEIAAKDPRVRLFSAPPLPEGWCGKQHACYVLAQHARYDLFAFLDADVRLEPHGLRVLSDSMQKSNSQLISGIPRQITGTLFERLLIPLIHLMLLGYLPMFGMKRSRRPGFGAGCGQLFLVERQAYFAAGGHAAIRTTLHDGIKLPRLFRRAGFHTDLVDATDIASCRMYRTNQQVWLGLAKNATEGMAAPSLIVPFTLMLTLGHILPFVFLLAWDSLEPLARWLILAACACSIYMRIDAAIRYQQSWLTVLLHPVGITLLLALQWYSFIRFLLGKPAGWKGRSYPSIQQHASF